MGFIGALFTLSLPFIFIAAMVGLVYIGLGLIIAGTIIMNRTQRRNLGVCLRVWGYIIAIPAFIIGFMFGTIFVFLPTLFGVIGAIVTCRLLGKPKA